MSESSPNARRVGLRHETITRAPSFSCDCRASLLTGEAAGAEGGRATQAAQEREITAPSDRGRSGEAAGGAQTSRQADKPVRRARVQSLHEAAAAGAYAAHAHAKTRYDNIFYRG
eukprot:8617865-Pyramimonas_sp.AAC.1